MIDNEEELDNYLIEECEYSETEVQSWDLYEKIDRYFHYDGLIGYTDFILNIAKLYWKNNLEELLEEE